MHLFYLLHDNDCVYSCTRNRDIYPVAKFTHLTKLEIIISCSILWTKWNKPSQIATISTTELLCHTQPPSRLSFTTWKIDTGLYCYSNGMQLKGAVGRYQYIHWFFNWYCKQSWTDSTGMMRVIVLQIVSVVAIVVAVVAVVLMVEGRYEIKWLAWYWMKFTYMAYPLQREKF